jgi:hypothetical protein
MLLSFLAFGLAFAWLLVHRYRLEALEERYEQEGFTSALEARRAEGSEPAPTFAGSPADESAPRPPAEVPAR